MNSLSMKEMILNRRYQGSIPSRGRRFLTFSMARPALGHTQPFVQCVPGSLSLGVKQPGSEADHSPPSSAEDKNGGDIPPLPHMSLWHSAYLIKDRDNFTFYIITLIFNHHGLGIGVLVPGSGGGASGQLTQE
jgi:hypothetical protein